MANKTQFVKASDGSMVPVRLIDNGEEWFPGIATFHYPIIARGSYAFDVATGTMAAGLAGGSPIFSFRWGDNSGKLALLRRVAVSMMSLGTGFTAGVGRFDLMVARAFTASDTGGNAVTLTTNNAKKRTSFPTTLLTSARISSTGTLSAGTRTLDTNALASIMFGIDTTINKVFQPTASIYEPKLGDNMWPLICSQDEGFVIQATVPATGTWQARVTCEWDEVLTY
jgi:hypothetical protein